MIYAWRFDCVSNEDCDYELGIDDDGLYLKIRPSEQIARKEVNE